MKIATIAATALLLATPAHADDVVAWKTVGTWQVLVDTTAGNGCFVTTFIDSTAVRIGFTPATGTLHFVFANTAWQFFEPGSIYLIEFHLDQRTPWTAQATAFISGGVPALAAPANNPELFHDVARSAKLVLRYEQRELARLSLDGSAAALSEMLSCQEAMDDAVPTLAPEADPFKRS